MKNPTFNLGFNSYLHVSRSSTITTVSGWEKKHYTPNPEDVFGIDRDVYIYTSPDKKLRFVITIERDTINIHFYLTEATMYNVRDLWSASYVDRKKQLNLTHQLDIALDEFNKSPHRLNVVDSLPDITSLTENQFFFKKTTTGLLLYYADADHGIYIQIEDAIEIFNENNRDTTHSIWGSADLLEHSPDIQEEEVKFSTHNGDGQFSRLIDSLAIFQGICNIPEAVISDISNIIKAKKQLFIEFRNSLPERIQQDEEGLMREIKETLSQIGESANSLHVRVMIDWFKADNKPGVALFLLLCFPENNNYYLRANQEALSLIMAHPDEDPVTQLRNFAIVALRISNFTNKEEDIKIAMKAVAELSGETGMDAVLDTDGTTNERLISLAVEQADQIRALKEQISQLKLSVAGKQNNFESGEDDLTWPSPLQFTPSERSHPLTSAGVTRPRRISYP